MSKITYIELEAGVRYWEDATVNGIEDTEGLLVPLRRGKSWCPVIKLEDGKVMQWPEGATAKIHYKVCDAGSYWLLDENGDIVASRENEYVPRGLCVGDNGYGDYIIMNIAANGFIEGWKRPDINMDEWKRLAQ